ncbi:hypothetical protein ES708_14150 [subsurface metagenome]
MVWAGSDGTHYRLAFAYSSDGKSWTEYDGETINGNTNPVILYSNDNGGQAWEETENISKVQYPTLYYKDETFYLFYGAATPGNRGGVGYTTFTWNNNTNDIENFQRHAGNPVIDLAEDSYFESGCGHIDISYYDGIYYMYAVRVGLSFAHGELALLTSSDMNNWTNKGKVLGRSLSGWDSQTVYRASPVTDGTGNIVLFNDKLNLYYSGYDISTGDPNIGLAYSTMELYGDCELFNVSEEKGIYHVSHSGWTINANTSIFLYYDKDHADNVEYLSDGNSFMVEESSVDDLDCNQGVATDGTYLYTVSSTLITKHNMSGGVLDTHVDAHLVGTDMEQINAVHIYDGKLYIGGSNYATIPKLGYIKVFDADTLDYIEEHQVLDHWCEGCAYHDGFFWVVYCEFKYVSKYNSDWEWQADYAVDYTTVGDERKIGYQGITWKDDDIFLPIHGDIPIPLIDRYHWTGSAFERRERITPPDDAHQGICYLASNDRFYIVQRHHLEAGVHSVTIAEFKSAMAAKKVWDDNFGLVSHQADETTSTIKGSTSNCNDGAKKAANEPNQVDGKVSKAQDLDGTDDYISIPHDASIDFADEDFTINFIVKATEGDLDFGARLLCKGLSGAPGKRYEVSIGADSIGFIIDDHTIKTEKYWGDLTNWADGDSHMLTFIRDTTNNLIKIYNDGVFKVSEVDGTGSIANTNDLQLGRKDPAEADLYFDGILDEFQVSGCVRPVAWLLGTYNSLWDSLFTYGSEETAVNAIWFGTNF